jgi:hypothetical protein
MSHLENILESNLETVKNLIDASKLHSETINLLCKRITTLEMEKATLTARVKNWKMIKNFVKKV